MFERFTEKARRVIFFAHSEASRMGSPTIDSEHLLLGLVRADLPLLNCFLAKASSEEALLGEVLAGMRMSESRPASTYLPLSTECKRILAFAAEEAERLRHRHIGTEHLLLGLLREEKSQAARMLRKWGADLEQIRRRLADDSRGSAASGGDFSEYT